MAVSSNSVSSHSASVSLANVRALEAAVAGQSVLDPGVQASLLKAAQQAPRPKHQPDRHAAPLPDGLTEREAEVLALIAGGLSNNEIADRLYVAESTVKTHVNRIFAKTNSRDRAQATLYAHRHGLVAEPAEPTAPAASSDGAPPAPG